jgi:CRP-like cAMP-binding protein
MVTREFLKSVELFADLRDEDAVALAAIAKEEVFRKGDVVFREREAGEKIYVVMAGVVEISTAGPGEGRSYCLARLERGEVLGEMAVFDRGPRSASAAAGVVPETRLAAWPAADFQKFLADRPAAAAALLGPFVRKLSARLRITSDAVRVLLRALEPAAGK